MAAAAYVLVRVIFVVPRRKTPKTQNPPAHRSRLLDGYAPLTHRALNGYRRLFFGRIGAFVHDGSIVLRNEDMDDDEGEAKQQQVISK